MHETPPRILILTVFAACAGSSETLDVPDGGGTDVANAVTGGALDSGVSLGGTGIDAGDAASRRAEVLRTLPRPIGEWLFDDGGGAVVRDSSGNGNTATVMKGHSTPGIAAPEVWKPGAPLELNGVDEWVRVPFSDSIGRTHVNNAVTISAKVFVRPGSLSGTRISLFERHHEYSHRSDMYFLGISRSGNLEIETNFFSATAFEPFPLGRFVHVAMTYDGIQQCGYIDGKSVTCQDVGWPLEADTTPFMMGAGIRDSDVNQNMTGSIDDVRLYDVALSAEQIAALAWSGP
jgi:Concanavalin A-like lectin/glucanases superfamily